MNKMPQNEYIEQHIKRYGRRFDHFERQRKKEGRFAHVRSRKARTLRGIKAKLYNRQRRVEKITMKRTIKSHEERETKTERKAKEDDYPIPSYLIDRNEESRAKVLSNTIKQKRKEKGGKWTVPIPKIGAVSREFTFFHWAHN
ncbi:hypothetical protein ACOME3_004971 [Neoechinorhynchus agilis]